MKCISKLCSILAAIGLAVFLALPAAASDLASGGVDVTILYTNDIHTYIDKELTYSKIAALKRDKDALLVDAGDHAQGTAYGAMDNGATIIRLMNLTGYDLATLGNHEFDYGMDGAMALIAEADFPYVSCNFYHENNGVPGETVLDSYAVLEKNGKKIAFIGITTPESVTSSTPAYFQDDNGQYIYDIAGGTDGSALYEAVQKAIDSAGLEADYVIALGHLGIDQSSVPWTSEDVIANTSGLDAFIDGHSHSAVEEKEIADKDGNTVLLTQTGSYLDAVGEMTITADGKISTKLITAETAADVAPDANVLALENAWKAQISEQLGKVIGHTGDTFDNFDADGVRLVRKQETNTGDFCTDAFYYLFANMGLDVDAAIINGGGIRNAAITGDISYLTCKEIFPFGNVACLIQVTGQQLLDALEWGAKDVSQDGSLENGGFLQVSGLRYEVDASVPSTVQKDDKGVWAGAPTGGYRVKNVRILNGNTGAYEPIDLNATYNLAGYNYTLRNMGDGFNMFHGAVNILDYVMEDYMVLANYVTSFENGEVTGYSAPAGRITILP